MTGPWWKADPQDLQRVSERISSLYVERCHVDRDENAVTLVNRERVVRVPAAMLATLLLGPGTRITQAAVALLADSGTAVCWVGERGVRMYASGIGASRGSAMILRQAWLVTRPSERLRVARAMYGMRFPHDDVSALTMRQLRGKEGSRVRELYRAESKRTGVKWVRREYRAGDAFAAGDDVNRLLSAANTALYGICHAAIVGVGASAALGFVHTGSAVSFVLDIADLYKADITIPIAFELSAEGRVEERDARLAVRDRVADVDLLATIVRDVRFLLEADEASDRDLHELWDHEGGTVAGGTNWDPDRHFELIGPELEG